MLKRKWTTTEIKLKVRVSILREIAEIYSKYQEMYKENGSVYDFHKTLQKNLSKHKLPNLRRSY